ncbi:hypothetical protein B0I35DRAFT_361182 [Stachybotrys elegans]|uniref:ADF-H domain-containing protein n=1 Tax=Stachybotrys elegans TaxID=80388 RepID=A0A8K0SHT7_9HYPO|nr:hypothetical protein B0I35DRAFT_361182 [Stachybotrys elegans]
MSLNGLDGPQLKEAHDAVASEPGGWFLLKYASRDEVELLSRGNGGIAEVRKAIGDYDETSPLYGFLKYRRRNVIIKYLPEDCSRLIQARVAVHFTAVCDRLAPYDTTYEISDPDELRDTKLSAACSLHAASASNSSSNSSLRRRRLVEIAEEEEEEPRSAKRKSTVQENGEDAVQHPKSPVISAEPVTLNAELATSPDQSKFSAENTSDVPNFVGVDERPVSPTEAARRSSSQSARPDLYSSSSYPNSKPKVKLGPRPSIDVISRPQTAGNFRPVSAIPAGFKLFGKSGQKKSKTKEDGESVHEVELTTNPLPALEESAKTEPDTKRPNTSSGASTKLSLTTALQAPSKPTMTPEKARLMKAMKLREKKKKAAAEQMKMEGQDVDADGDQTKAGSEHAEHANEQAEAELPSHSDKSELEDSSPLEHEKRITMIHADSGVILDHVDQESEKTHTDSRPHSPTIASSEPDASTKASSVSESTDETVQATYSDAEKPDPTSQNDMDEEAGKPDDARQSSPAQAERADDSAVILPAEEAAKENKDQVDDSNSRPASAQAPPVPQVSEDAIQAEISEVPADTDSAAVKVSPTIEISEVKFESKIVPDVSTEDVADDVSNEADDDDDDTATIPALDTPTSRPRPSNMSIRTDLAQNHTRQVSVAESNLSDDEELMEELRSATVQEATPMTVAKTPLTPVFPKLTPATPPTHMVRTVSNPIRGSFIVPGDVSQSSARSVSSSGAALLHKITQQQAAGANLAKKNVGSSISQRIKALEMLSVNQGGPAESPSSSPAASRERPSSAFFSVRKGREPSRSPSVVDRATPFTKNSTPAPPSSSGVSREPSPGEPRERQRDRSLSVASRLSMFESSPGPKPVSQSSSRTRGRPESVSVSAKIIRDPDQNAVKMLEPPKDPSEFQHLELKQSPLVVDHQRALPEQEVAIEVEESLYDRRMSRESRRDELQDTSKESKRRSSITRMKDFIKDRRKSITSPSSDVLSPFQSAPSSRSPTRPPSVHQNSSGSNTFPHRLSIGSRRSLSKDREIVFSPTTLTEGSLSSDEAKSTASDKIKSRAGRFMRRLSNLSGGGSRSRPSPPILSPTLTEEEHTEPTITIQRPSTMNTPAIVSDMGDVNVQFPDNLLWKRRSMCIDAQGFLILSALPAQLGRPAQSTKRYHLSEFRTPYIPDVEVQELPNSVVLDFVDGSGIQVACEDRSGQTRILQIVREAHASHAQAFGR